MSDASIDATAGSSSGSDVESDEPLPGRGYRSYEVYQRERVGESTNLISPRALISDDYLHDPYPLVATLREHYPCYRDWVGNRFWITRYDDVTSVLADTANYAPRPRAVAYPQAAGATSLWSEVDFEWSLTRRVDEALDAVVDRVLDSLGPRPDLATEFAARIPLELWCEALGIVDTEDRTRFAALWWRMHRGAGWHPGDRVDGADAFDELTSWLDRSMAAASTSDDNLISTARQQGASGRDLAVSLLEADHETLHGGLANLWMQLLTNPDQLAAVQSEPRRMKFAWLETLRHSPAVIHAARFARHEVERFGRLLPAGALLWCSTAAANRDPRAFSDPELFCVDRHDLCQREPRGQYRADGLPSGIAVGLGLPSAHPAAPKERPRSRYALTRDVAVVASNALLVRWPQITLADGAAPSMRSVRLAEMHTCWSLPVTLG